MAKAAKMKFDKAGVDFQENFVKSAGHGSKMTLKTKSGTHTTDGAAGTETITGLIPAGTLVIGLSIRVTSAITGVTTNFDIGISGALTRYGENVLKAAGTTTTLADAATASSPMYYPSATDVLLTADAGTFTGGEIRYKLYYYDMTAPTS